jgi:signal transduction histidine kinase
MTGFSAVSLLERHDERSFGQHRQIDWRPTALADRLVLRQALINLVDNAIKFSPAGRDILIRLGETAHEASFEVSDSGPGISADAKPRIFDRFYRSGDAEAGGTGLGLSIAKGAIEANGAA